jgi:hypothetical protein
MIIVKGFDSSTPASRKPCYTKLSHSLCTGVQKLPLREKRARAKNACLMIRV